MSASYSCTNHAQCFNGVLVRVVRRLRVSSVGLFPVGPRACACMCRPGEGLRARLGLDTKGRWLRVLAKHSVTDPGGSLGSAEPPFFLSF